MDAVTREMLEARFDAAIEEVPGADPFEPTPFGERVLKTLVVLVTETAPEGAAVWAYDQCEHGLLDQIAMDLRASMVDRLLAIGSAS